MIVAGIDIGSIASKIVILDDKKILHQSVINENEDKINLPDIVFDRELDNIGLSRSDIKYIIATGINRESLSFADRKKSTSLCLAKGAYYLFPSARLVIDIGAETSTVVGIGDKGVLKDSAVNDKCAAGAGSFLLLLVKLLQMPLERLSEISLEAKGKIEFTNTCVVFIEQEIISQIHRDPPTPMSDIVAGIYESLATRIAGLAKRVGIKEDVVICGGVAKNRGFVKIFKEVIGVKLIIPESPEILPALGAALIAQREISK